MAVKCVTLQQEPWDVTALKKESENEVITGDCGVLLER
jgi:hypothetical protein